MLVSFRLGVDPVDIPEIVHKQAMIQLATLPLPVKLQMAITVFEVVHAAGVVYRASKGV